MVRIKLVALLGGAAAVVVGLSLRREREVEQRAARLRELHDRYAEWEALREAMDGAGEAGTARLLEDVA